MKQIGLFGNLPQMNKVTKEANKQIVKKASKPKKSKTKTVRATGNKIEKKLQLITQHAQSELEDKGLYELITTEQRLTQYLDKANKQGVLSVDTETTGLDPILDDIVGICIYTPTEKPAYIPLKHTDINKNLLPNQLPVKTVVDEFNKLTNVKHIFHNAKFDIRVLRNSLNLYLEPHWDTQLAGNFLNENEPHGLKYLWNKYCNTVEDTSEQTFNKLFEDVPFNYIPIEIGYLYAAKDSLMTYELYKFQDQFLDPNHEKCKIQKLEEASKQLREVEIPLITVLCDMEDTGVTIDKEYANGLSTKYEGMMEEVLNKLVYFTNTYVNKSVIPLEKREKLSDPVNFNSPAQLGIIIYDVLGLKSPDKRKPRGTGEEILQYFADNSKNNEQLSNFFKDILEYRGLKKLLSTYINKMPNIVKEKTGKLHGQFNQYGAKTGRFSSSDPNLQNIPSGNKEIRKMFTASEGYYLIGGDYS